jgi:hypothetical protein
VFPLKETPKYGFVGLVDPFLKLFEKWNAIVNVERSNIEKRKIQLNLKTDFGFKIN